MGTKHAIENRAIAPPEGGENGEHAPPSAIQLTEKQFRHLLINLSHQAGSMAELARRLDITGQYMGEIIAGKKRPGPKLLRKLSAKAITTYEITVEAETTQYVRSSSGATAEQIAEKRAEFARMKAEREAIEQEVRAEVERRMETNGHK